MTPDWFIILRDQINVLKQASVLNHEKIPIHTIDCR
jgi:hypothetical protein